MSLPEALTTIAAVGTDKGSTLREMGDDLERVLNKRADLPLEGRVLLTAAGLHLQQQAGWLPAQDNRPVPEPCEDDTLPTINMQALYHLAMMLDGDYLAVLPEWLREVAQRKLRIPEEILPLILEAGHKHKDLRDLIVPVLGKRGIWLAKQAVTRRWSWFDLTRAEQMWEKGSSEERVDLLEALRKVDPKRAREMVEAVWKEEKAEVRTFFLNMFKIGLSMDDEPFLEAALDDRAQDVRQAAIVLLGLLPESQFTQRMIARGLLLVELGTIGSKGKDKSLLAVKNIGQSDDQLRRDGIDLSEVKQRKQTKQQLTQFVLGHVPPNAWCQHFGISKEELIKVVMLAENDEDEYDLMINALAWGAYRARDIEFASLLVTTTLKRIESNVHNQLLHLLPDPDTVLVGLLKNRQGMSFEALFPSLRAHEQTWSIELAMTVCVQMAQAAQNATTFYALHTGLRDFAIHFPITHSNDLFNRLNKPVKQDATYGPTWQSALNDVRSMLDFRRDMLAALHS